MSASTPDPRRKLVQGTAYLCPTCRLSDLDAAAGLDVDPLPLAEDRPLSLTAIRQEIQTPGAPDRILLLCELCGRGRQLVVDVLREVPVRVDLAEVGRFFPEAG